MNEVFTVPFTSLSRWRECGRQLGAVTRLVTRSKSNDYWQAILGGEVIGFFNTKGPSGHLNVALAQRIELGKTEKQFKRRVFGEF